MTRITFGFLISLILSWSLDFTQSATGAETRAVEEELVSQIYQRQELACQLARKAVLLIFRSEGAGGIKQHSVLTDVASRCESERVDGYKFKPALSRDSRHLIALRERLQVLDKQIALLKQLIGTLETEEEDGARNE